MVAAEITGKVHWSKCCSHGISTCQKLEWFFWKPGQRPGKGLQQLPRLQQIFGDLPLTPWHALGAVGEVQALQFVPSMGLAALLRVHQLGALLILPETLEPVSHFNHCFSLRKINWEHRSSRIGVWRVRSRSCPTGTKAERLGCALCPKESTLRRRNEKVSSCQLWEEPQSGLLLH